MLPKSCVFVVGTLLKFWTQTILHVPPVFKPGGRQNYTEFFSSLVLRTPYCFHCFIWFVIMVEEAKLNFFICHESLKAAGDLQRKTFMNKTLIHLVILNTAFFHSRGLFQFMVSLHDWGSCIPARYIEMIIRQRCYSRKCEEEIAWVWLAAPCCNRL